MTAVIQLPRSIDDQTMEPVFTELARLTPDARLLLDARHSTFATPYGLSALLTIAQTRQTKPEFATPLDQEKSSYWARSGFFRHAEELMTLHGHVPRSRVSGDTDVLLEMTPITKSDDVHVVVERIQQKAADILINKLHLESRITMGFAMTLSEACQNIVEHAGRGGWVMVQTYHYRKRLGRYVVQMAVCDAGVGFRQSLEESHSRMITDRWDDAKALETAVFNGVSRYRDPGRGQGLRGIRGFIHRWDGKLSVRSGSARVALVPSWDDDVANRDDLAPFPGAQLLIMIPEAIQEGAVRPRSESPAR